MKFGKHLGNLVSWVLVVVGISLQGCASHRQSAPPTADSAGNSPQAIVSGPVVARDGHALGLQLITGDGAAKNTPALTASSPEKVMVDGNSIVLSNRLTIPQGAAAQPLYLAWPATFADTRIAEATFEYQRVDSSNVAIGSPSRQNVSLDATGDRWFISLSDQFGADLGGVNPLDTQTFKLDLLLADMTRVSIQVSFILEGPFPANVRMGESGAVQPNILAWNDPAFRPSLISFMNSGYNYLTDHFTNPTSKPLTLWARVKASSATQTVLSVHSTNGSIGGNWWPVRSDPVYSQYALDGGNVQVLHRQGDAISFEKIGTALGQWISIAMAPGESVQVAWFALPSSSVSACSLPAPGMQGTVIQDFWYLTGTTISGQIARDVWLTEDGSQPQDNGSATDSKLIDSQSTKLSLTAGLIQPNPAPFSCQGPFLQ
jgi:hypothetical protein